MKRSIVRKLLFIIFQKEKELLGFRLKKKEIISEATAEDYNYCRSGDELLLRFLLFKNSDLENYYTPEQFDN